MSWSMAATAYRPSRSRAAQRELGIIIETSATTQEAAVLLASLVTHYLIHYGYPGRKATAGNIAYPLSPNLVSFKREDGRFGAIVPSGTRDPVFFENYATIKAAVLKLIADEFPDALDSADLHDHGRRRRESRHAAAHRRSRPEAARCSPPAGNRPHHALGKTRSRLATQSRCSRCLCLVALPPAAERGRDQERHVPDHLLQGRWRRVDRARASPGRATSTSASATIPATSTTARSR